jgi:cyclase
MFVGVHPVMWAGPTPRWIAALDRILALDPALVVPGHGPLAGVAEVRLLRDYLVWLDAAALAALAGGGDVVSVALELARSPEFVAAPWTQWSGPERMVISIATIERHRRGIGARPIDARTRAQVFRQVASVARSLGWRP